MFNYSAVMSWEMTVTNRLWPQPRLGWVTCYLDNLKAIPPSTQFAPVTRGYVYTLAGLQGTARAPVSLTFQQPPSAGAVTTLTAAGPGTYTVPGGTAWGKVEATGGGGAGRDDDRGRDRPRRVRGGVRRRAGVPDVGGAVHPVRGRVGRAAGRRPGAGAGQHLRAGPVRDDAGGRERRRQRGGELRRTGAGRHRVGEQRGEPGRGGAGQPGGHPRRGRRVGGQRRRAGPGPAGHRVRAVHHPRHRELDVPGGGVPGPRRDVGRRRRRAAAAPGSGTGRAPRGAAGSTATRWSRSPPGTCTRW